MELGRLERARGSNLALDKHVGGRLHSDKEVEMELHSLFTLLKLMSPMVWICIGSLILAGVLIKVLVLSALDD